MIGTNIVVTVIKVANGRVTLGFNAPGLPVHREEIHRDVQRNGPRRRHALA